MKELDVVRDSEAFDLDGSPFNIKGFGISIEETAFLAFRWAIFLNTDARFLTCN